MGGSAPPPHSPGDGASGAIAEALGQALCLEYRGAKKGCRKSSRPIFVYSIFVPCVLVGFVLVSHGPMVWDLCN